MQLYASSPMRHTEKPVYPKDNERERDGERKGNEVKIQAKTRQDKNRRMAQMLYCQAMTPLTNCVYTLHAHTHMSSCIPQPIRIH